MPGIEDIGLPLHGLGDSVKVLIGLFRRIAFEHDMTGGYIVTQGQCRSRLLRNSVILDPLGCYIVLEACTCVHAAAWQRMKE